MSSPMLRPFPVLYLVAGIMCALGSSPAAAQPAGGDLEAATHRPTVVPDRIVMTWQTDPATSQAVTWRTDTTVVAAFVEVALADPSPRFVERARRIEARTSRFVSDLGAAHYHAANMTDLRPDTLYAYRVGDGVVWSEWFHFRTVDTDPKPFSFIYFGDAQKEIKSLWSRAIRAAFREAPDVRFMIHAGDLINDTKRDLEWGEWFDAGGWVHGSVASIPTPGNHEYETGPDGAPRLARQWRHLFTLPENGAEGLEESTYYVDVQGVRIISLNSNEQIERQAEWLEDVLADNPNDWTVATFHHPVYSSARGRDNTELRAAWKPLFDAYGVDLVLQGHDHTYARGRNLPVGANVQEVGGGPVYVVSVSGPKMYGQRPDRWMDRAAEDTQLFQVISVAGDTLRYEARTVTGTLYDAFDLVRRAGAPNHLVERVPPDVPERLRVRASSSP